MSIWSSTTRRLLTAFASFFVILGVATYFAMAGLVEVHESMHHVTNYNAGVRTALTLASAVRDQYAHQAHTIILGNASHLEFHKNAANNVQNLIRQLDGEVEDPGQRQSIRDIIQSSQELNQIFLDLIVPAVLAKDDDTVNREHARVLEVVSSIQENADRIAVTYGTAIALAEQHAAEVENSSFRYVTISQLCAILFAAAMAAYIGRSVARPLARLQAGAGILARGDLNSEIRIDSDDEFGRLAMQFNSMTAALREHQDRLVQSEKLAVIGRLAAGIAHEINNPLGVILGYVRLLKRRASADMTEDLEVIEEEAVRCQVIVEGLLDLGRPWQLSQTPVSLKDLSEEIYTRLKESQSLHDIRYETTGEAETMANEPALRQVLLNVIKNAAEAARPSGRVQVHLSHSPEGEVTISVTDSGPGLTPEASMRLFEPFFTTKAQGTGLGLAVSQAIIQAHGGYIEAESPSEGGATFRVFLPARKELHTEQAG